LKRDEYEAYLASPKWRETRRAALRRAGHACQVCNRGKRLQVHHRTYERVGREAEGDLTVLCKDCHEIFHDSGRVPNSNPIPKAKPKRRKPHPSQRRRRRRRSKKRHKGPSGCLDKPFVPEYEFLDESLRKSREARQPG
jgi:ssDNA-binding Zn-finger/Zn-ribbon topoisomerase 1